MAKQKYYVVWVGKVPGIYTSWGECQQQVNQFTGAKFKAFEARSEAEQAYAAGYKNYWGQQSGSGSSSSGSKSKSFKRSSASAAEDPGEIDYDSISVDVGTRGNPGPVEYKGVDTQTGDILFSCGPIQKGTNNLGEFLAIVHALAYLKKIGSTKTVYSDSMNALKWLKQKKVVSTLPRDASTKEIWDLVDRAEHWLRTNTYENKVLKWQTKSWGEIKADYGRK
ncbi:ribonuclease H [Paenibacillus lautus]|uniref:Ribonuclease H n=1 Tax=Paenibacillus lautus TaxID=1401 RepID=A0A385TEH9_PAELA|nr:ribonuclease H family protein [Paenibacillus lautus]AYB42076.1 ribonuclease H [Paenibacillus lautus]VTR31184.1 Ribonuclease H [Actinobacillus pleuropneumoniae]